MKTVVSRRASANFGLLQKASPDRPKLTHIVLAPRQVRSLSKSRQSYHSPFALAQLSRCADRIAEPNPTQQAKLSLRRRVDGLPPSSMSRHDASPILPRGATVFTYASKLRRGSPRRAPPNISSRARATTQGPLAPPE